MLNLLSFSLFFKGINTAADVANLVAKAFSNNNSNNQRKKPDLFSFLQNNNKPSTSQQSSSEQEGNHRDETENSEKQYETKASFVSPGKEAVGTNFGTSNLITSMLRLVGFDASKLGALAINALIMIASAVSFDFIA